MKKLKLILSILLVILVCCVCVSADGTNTSKNTKKSKTIVTREYCGVDVFVTHNGSPNIQCYKCKCATRVTCVGYSYCLGCPAWRRYDIANIKEGDAVYTTYRCPHGHTLLVSLTTDDIK